MIVWGGTALSDGDGGVILTTQFTDGARYDPNTDVWTPLPAENAPGGRGQTIALWTGDSMIIWGDGVSGARFLR